jgi:hypothetical protein
VFYDRQFLNEKIIDLQLLSFAYENSIGLRPPEEWMVSPSLNFIAKPTILSYAEGSIF